MLGKGAFLYNAVVSDGLNEFLSAVNGIDVNALRLERE